jgi:hypothetical protein
MIKRILDLLAPITKPDPQKGEPWVWHITETFKGLITLSVELVKMLALVNAARQWPCSRIWETSPRIILGGTRHN